MAIHVKDEVTTSLVRELARKRNIGITAAIRAAVSEALNADLDRSSLWDRTADLRAQIESHPATGMAADKAYFDSLWEDGETDVDGRFVRYGGNING